MARRISHDRGTIHAKAEDSEDDVTLEYDKIKHVSSKAVLFIIDKDEYWIPFSQLVDVYPGSNEARITNWIAGEKGLS